jgi:hypothetical protein
MDIADYNNDALPDVFVLDMMPVTNLRQKLMVGYRNLNKFHMSLDSGYHPQFMRNTLQLNLGKFQDGKYRFSEISYLAGMYQTDWSWAPLLADFDNDGWKDLFISNAHVNDTVEHFETTKYRLANSVFLNRGSTFTDASATFQTPRAHRGAAFADFDNDGRIDVAVSSLGEPAELWRNETESPNTWLIVKLEGTRSNRDAIGARVRVGGQHNHMTTSSGYNSSSHFGVHFGTGTAETVDVEIVWPSGATQRLERVRTNQVLRVTE